jgi:hypothetical protein
VSTRLLVPEKHVLRTAQGFFIQFNSGTHLFKCELVGILYLLVIRYNNWTEDRLRKTVQPILLRFTPSSGGLERRSRE